MLLEVNAVAWTMVDPYFADASADRLHIAGISIFKPFNAPDNFGPRHHVSQIRQKRAELIGASDFEHQNHMYPMGYRLSISVRALLDVFPQSGYERRMTQKTDNKSAKVQATLPAQNTWVDFFASPPIDDDFLKNRKRPKPQDST